MKPNQYNVPQINKLESILNSFTPEDIEKLLIVKEALKRLNDILTGKEALLKNEVFQLLENGDKQLLENDIVISKTSPTIMNESDYLENVEKAQEKLSVALQELEAFRKTGEMKEKTKPQIRITPKPKSERALMITNDAEKIVKRLIQADPQFQLLKIEPPVNVENE